MQDLHLLHPSEQIARVLRRIYNMGMTTTSGGNISILDEHGDIWVSPSAVDKGTLTDKDIVCIKKDGTIIGKHKPSSEFPFHKAIYAVRPDIRAIVHAHSSALVAFSIVREVPNTNISAPIKTVCGTLGYSTYATPGSDELGDKIAEAFTGNRNISILMENHGPVVGGVNLIDAYSRFETLELCAQTILHAKKIGEPNYLSQEQIETNAIKDSSDFSQQITTAYDFEERTIREEICNIVNRACDHQLMFGTQGAVSVRLKNNAFLITPDHIPLWSLKPEDLMKIESETTERTSNSLVFKHQQIYEQNPTINSILFAQPPHVMAYGITGNKFNVRTIPESYFTLLDILQLPFGSSFMGSDSAAFKFGKSVRALLIQNDCFMVTGDELMEAYDRLEVAEFSAKSLLMSASLGKMIPMDQKAIDALREKYVK